ncbi:alpha/beta hydrolase [Microbacterium aurum]
MSAMQAMMPLFPSPVASEKAVYRRIEGLRASSPVPRKLLASCDVQTSVLEGQKVITLVPHGLDEAAPNLIYVHGGAYVLPIGRPQWGILTELLDRTPARITVPLYSLAPGGKVDDALTFLSAVADSVLSQDRSLFIAGDSAGGGLALALAQHLRDSERVQAKALFLFSPWVDVEMRNPDIQSLETVDHALKVGPLLLCGQWWAGERALSDPKVSPINGNLAGLPSVHSFVGSSEIFFPDVSRLHDAILDAGGESALTVAPRGFHVYVSAAFVPESRVALDHVAAVLAG